MPYSPFDPVFSISPDAGHIPAGQTLDFNVAFQPRNTSDYEMVAICQIPNYSTEAAPIELSMVGQGVLPELHFLLPERESIHSWVRIFFLF